MAVQPFVQMIWGKPKIKIAFSVQELDGARCLRCDIYNLPIKARILRVMSIRRMVAEDILANYEIYECGTDKLVFTGAVPHIVKYDGSESQRISLAGSFFPAKFGIATVIYQEGQVKTFDKDQILAIGKYYAKVDIVADNEPIRKSCIFFVTKEHPYFYIDQLDNN
ncbi:MAG: hypothetical protein ACYDHZ_06110 [Dehalococcoidia bacterium]